MTIIQIALLALVVALLLAWLGLRLRSARAEPDLRAERIDTITGWPPQATRVLSSTDLVALATLTKAVPEFLVLAQVPMARFIDVPKRNSYADWLRRVGYQSVDFLICDLSAHVIAVVELQPLQLSDRARKRHDRIARTLKAAHIPLHVWRETGLPAVDTVRDALMPRPSEGAPAPSKSAVPPARPGTTSRPFADTDREAPHEEATEMLEPPPSTWFDDLDSDPVPLSKR